MFPWWVRLFIFLPLGALQIILITMKVFGWQYEVGFEQFMIVLGEWVSGLLFLDVIEAAIRDLLAGWNIVLPQLGKHWHHVFVLLWIFMAAIMRSTSSKINASLPAGLALTLFAGLCALILAFIAGMTQGDEFIAAPFMGLFLFYAVASSFARTRKADLIQLFGGVAFITIANVLPPFTNDPAPLLAIAGIVCTFGLMYFVLGLLFTTGTLRQRLDDPDVALGLDIIGPFVVAATAAWIFGKYIPI